MKILKAFAIAAAGLLFAGMGRAEDAPKACKYVNLRTLPISFSGFRPTIDGSINGKPITMLVDTGAFSTRLFKRAADRLNLTLSHTGESVVGVGGESFEYNALLKELTIGPLKAERFKVGIIQDVSEGLPYDGLVGANILFQRDIEISLAGQYIKFFYPVGCDDTFLAYWDPNASVVGVRSISDQDPRQVVDVMLNGQKIRALIDTGAPTSVVDIKAATRLGITAQSANVVKAGKDSGIGKNQTDSWIASFDSFSIGDENIKNFKLRVIDIWKAAASDLRSVDQTGALQREEPEMILGADFLRAHRLLFAGSQHSLYFSYVGGNVFYTDGDQDIGWYKKAAELGNPDAQYNLARFYMEGKGVSKDDALAVSWLTKSAEKGYAPAQAQLGWLYANGEGVKKDDAQAAAWYVKAAAQENLWAQNELGHMYENGRGVQKDFAQAMDWYRKAAEKNDAEAQNNIGRMYWYGNGVQRDEKQALDWYRKAADQGSASAEVNLGWIYARGGSGLAKDTARAREWYRKAAEKKFIPAYLPLARILFFSGDFAESAKNFELAEPVPPQDRYLPFWKFLAKSRAGDTDTAVKELNAADAAQHERKWPAPIAAFYLRRLTADALLAAARDQNKEKARAQVCEANFYIAEEYLLEGKKKEARPLLESARRDCPTDFIEYDASGNELERLGSD